MQYACISLSLATAAMSAGFSASAAADPQALEAFAAYCFNPLMTAERAAEVLPARHDFYDLDPFRSETEISPPQGRAVTQGTDRRCEVAFDGEAVAAARDTVISALDREGSLTEADGPPDFPAQDGAAFVAARQRNPNRIAVVQVGTRPRPSGPETFINVERLLQLED